MDSKYIKLLFPTIRIECQSKNWLETSKENRINLLQNYRSCQTILIVSNKEQVTKFTNMTLYFAGMERLYGQKTSHKRKLKRSEIWAGNNKMRFSLEKCSWGENQPNRAIQSEGGLQGKNIQHNYCIYNPTHPAAGEHVSLQKEIKREAEKVKSYFHTQGKHPIERILF